MSFALYLNGMLILLSPAKNMDFTAPPIEIAKTLPRLDTDLAVLRNVTAKLTPSRIATLMHLSDKLADLNWHRYRLLADPVSAQGTIQAIFAYNGDVYQGLSARNLTHSDLNWAQDHLRILSGLYGLLRPFDTIAPHRLEMGTRLTTRRGDCLYDFWGSRISKALNADLAGDADPVIINLSSSEYFGAVDKKALKARIITCHFKEVKDGEARVLSFYAKKARGMMARFAIENRIDRPAGLADFSAGGYMFDNVLSKADNWIFTRPQPSLPSLC